MAVTEPNRSDAPDGLPAAPDEHPLFRATGEESAPRASDAAYEVSSPLQLTARTLETRAALDEGADPVLVAFAAWLGASPAPSGSAREPSKYARRVIEIASALRGAARRYHDVAVLGYAVALPDAPSDVHAAWTDGLAWLRGRRFFVPHQPPGLEADGLALLGIAAGVSADVVKADGPEADGIFGRHIASGGPGSESAVAWLRDLIERAIESGSKSDEWEGSLLHAALALVTPRQRGVESGSQSQRSVGDGSVLGDHLAPDIIAALAARGYMTLAPAEELAALQCIVSPDVAFVAPERAVVQRVALRWLMRQGATALPRRATIADVVALLCAVPHALKRWPWEQKAKTTRAGVSPQRWDIQNEYHVQSLLWTILAPLFPDLVDEEYLRSVGHSHPRVDLALPSLQLLIEVKYLREGIQSAFTSIINEVSADTGLYLSIPSEFTAILVFVWDDAGATNHHAELLRGLRSLRGVTDAVVVPRPGGWAPRV